MINKKRMRKENLLWRIWDFLWNSNSVWSWIADMVVLYIIVKLIFFPMAGLIAGTSLPSVIVESESMVHTSNFDGWWQSFGNWYIEHNFTKSQISSWPFRNGINKGDIIVLKGVKKSSLRLGDVIVFDAHQKRPIIHRVIRLEGMISTKGDNNRDQLSVEKEIPEDKIIGKAIFRIPKAGWVKLIFVEPINFIRKQLNF